MKKNFAAVLATAFLLLLVGSAPAWAQRDEHITDGPRVKQTTETSAEISWSTTAAGSSIVRYGMSPDKLLELAEQPWGGTHEPNGNFNHTVWVKNLRPNTRYFFVVVTGQGRGTGSGALSAVQEFHTEPR